MKVKKEWQPNKELYLYAQSTISQWNKPRLIQEVQSQSKLIAELNKAINENQNNNQDVITIAEIKRLLNKQLEETKILEEKLDTERTKYKNLFADFQELKDNYAVMRERLVKLMNTPVQNLFKGN